MITPEQLQPDPPRVLLTIAGFDPSTGAGVTADLQTMQAHGFFGTAAATALTVQSTLGVQRWQSVEAELLRDTLECLHEDIAPAGVKIGMLGSSPNIDIVTSYLERLPPSTPVVLDPVLLASLGDGAGQTLLGVDGLTLMQQKLLPHVTWVTPNLTELAKLTGKSVDDHKQVEAAARDLLAKYPGLSVVATGGHLAQPDDLVLTTDQTATWIAGTWLDTLATHGTGCAFSTALLCGLVQGKTGREAAVQAKSFVAEAMRRAPRIGHGRGPLNLLWPLR